VGTKQLFELFELFVKHIFRCLGVKRSPNGSNQTVSQTCLCLAIEVVPLVVFSLEKLSFV